MKKLVALAAATFLTGAFAGAGVYAFAAGPRTYQVTGPVLESRADAIVVKKGTDNWEIAKDSSTKVTGDVKVGSKVLVMYRMTAASIDVKPDAAAKKK